MSFFENTRKPVGFGGKLMVAMMNLGHSPVARWGLHFLELTPDAKVLDCGCGGGANIKRLLKKCPEGILFLRGVLLLFDRAGQSSCAGYGRRLPRR